MTIETINTVNIILAVVALASVLGYFAVKNKPEMKKLGRVLVVVALACVAVGVLLGILFYMQNR